MDVFFTDPASLEEISGTPFVNLTRDFALRDQLPFILDDDGTYDPDINRFFRRLPTDGAKAPLTWKAYAYDLLTWLRFLKEARKNSSVWTVTRDDIDAFAAWRCARDIGHRIEPNTWNRNIAALFRFYEYARTENLVRSNPFAKTDSKGFESGAREKGIRLHDVKYLSMADYKTFRDVGLAGRNPPNDATSQDDNVRNAARNVAAAELMVTTGIRSQENAALVRFELPAVASSEKKQLAMQISKGTAKRSKSRKVWIPVRVLSAINNYVRIERRQYVAQGRAAWFGIERPIKLVAPTFLGATMRTSIGATHVQWQELNAGERFNCVVVDSNGFPIEPACLWVSEHGTPVSLSNWSSVFRRASERCARHGIQIHAYPHKLRHTFAVHMLDALIKAQVTSADLKALGDGAYRRILGDPLRTLQKLLGHASIETTYIYLDSLAEAQDTIDLAYEEFKSAAEADGISDGP